MIYIITGGPGEGKSFYASKWALAELLRSDKSKKKKNVYTNFPLVHKTKKKTFSSYIWKPEYVYENILDSLVFVDESYMDFNCKDSANFDLNTQVFFSQQRHNGNNLVMLSPNPARINIAIREMANEIIQVKAHLNFLIGHPLYFTAELFISIEDFQSRFIGVKSFTRRELCFFSKKVAKAYDTHAFRKQGEPFEPTKWDNTQPEIKPNIFNRFLSRMHRKKDQMI